MKTEKLYDSENITRIKSLIKDSLIIEDLILYKYSEYDELLYMIDDAEFVPIPLENSFLEYTIESKKLEFDNHITSNKHYKSKFDNPKDLTIRGLLMFPIIENKKTIGILSMCRSSRQNINFTKKDRDEIEYFHSLLCKLINKESISEDYLIPFYTRRKEDSKKYIDTKEANEKEIDEKKVKVTDKSQVKIKKLEREIESINKSKVELEKIVKEYMIKEIEDKKRDKKNSKKQVEDKQVDKLVHVNLKKLEQELETINKSKAELEKVVKEYMTKEIEDKKKNEIELVELDKLKKELEKLKANRDIQAKNMGILEQELINIKEIKQDNEDLRADIKERNALILKHSNNQIKEKHNKKKLPNNFEKISENIEFLLKEMDCKFSGNKNSYTLFEMMIYAISSHKGMDIIEDFITKSKDFSNFVNIFYNSITIKPNRKKYQIKKVFEDKIRNNLSFDESLPVSLVVDTPKINSILHHIEENLTLISKDKELIDTDISYSKQRLLININTKVEQKNSVLQSIFKQKIVDENEQELMICNKLVKLLGGELNSSYDDENYQYTIALPAKIIDLNFV